MSIYINVSDAKPVQRRHATKANPSQKMRCNAGTQDPLGGWDPVGCSALVLRVR